MDLFLNYIKKTIQKLSWIEAALSMLLKWKVVVDPLLQLLHSYVAAD